MSKAAARCSFPLFSFDVLGLQDISDATSKLECLEAAIRHAETRRDGLLEVTAALEERNRGSLEECEAADKELMVKTECLDVSALYTAV